MASVNVELKARDADPRTTAARCRALGARDHGVLEQRDTYFHGRVGRLKLRQTADGPAELIAYRRPDGAEPGASGYVRAPAGDPAALREALVAALGPAIVVVDKRRRLFTWESVRIHLDEVEGLGTFVELESIVGGDAGEARARAALARLRAELAIADDALVAVSYCDLLLDAPAALLAAAEAAMRRAYAPYSQFKVGAAVRGATGAIYAGANVENVAFPQGQCAEASAIGALVTAGESALTEVAVVAERLEHCPPCGGCRQRLVEFGSASTPVHLGRPGAAPRTTTLGELLPGSFHRAALRS
ncbi:MAG: cytidine deaminase [Solirubrobacterales bacterium]|nr:cytidine deaminase [Solirubrobacterales bacterium]